MSWLGFSGSGWGCGCAGGEKGFRSGCVGGLVGVTWRSADEPCGELYNVLVTSVLLCIAAVRWKGFVEVEDGGRGVRDGDDEAKATCSRELTEAGGEGRLRVFP